MKKILIFVSIFLISIFASAQQHIISFEVMNKSEISKLPNYLSIDNVVGNEVTAYISEDNLQEFTKLGYNFTEVKNSQPKVLNMATTTAQMANWDRYPTYDVYVQMMQDFATDYPNICKLDTIGVSQNGHLILVVRITDNVNSNETEPEFFYTSTMHGDETTGFVLMLRLVDYLLTNYGSDAEVSNLVNNYDIWINPLANPDGTYNGGDNTVSGSVRLLANGDDPNRDFPYPLEPNHSTTNPETVAMMNFADAHNFVMSANFHGGAEVYNYPWDCWTSSQNTHPDDSWFAHLGTNYVQSARVLNSSYMTSVVASGVTEGADWYYAYGSRQDYMNYFHHCREVTIELSNTKILSTDELPTYWNYNKQSFLDYMKEAIYGFNGTVKNTSGEPLDAKIIISAHDVDNSEVYTDLITGDYYRPIAPGTYDVTYSSEGYISQTHEVTVSDWKTTTIKNVVLEQASQITLTGTVIDASTSLPLQGVMISFLNTTISDVETDANGHYSITIPENEYTIQASKFGYSTAIVTETISANNNVVDFALLTSEAIDFENDIPSEITFSGNADWFRTTDQAYEGAYCIKSGDISDNQTSVMTLTATTSAGTISFYKKVSCENDPNDNYDFLKFEIDGVEQDRWDGEVDWSQESFVITEGAHTFVWSYEKDGSTSSGEDCAWVDYIELPSEQPTSFNVTFNVSSSGTPIEDATISLTGYGLGNTNASGEYIFNDVYQATDSIAYTVSAAGFHTVSGKVFVNSNITENVNLSVNASVNSITDNIELYPNPTKGVINIKLPVQNGVIQVLSISGKIIKTINVNSKNQILNLSDQPEGIYFIKFYSDNNIYTEKIVLQK